MLRPHSCVLSIQPGSVSLTCLQLGDVNSRMILCHMLEHLVHSNASTCQRSLRLPLLGEGRQGAEQMGGPQRCPEKKKRPKKMVWYLSSLPGLFHSVQCPLLHSWGCKQMVGFLFKSRIIFWCVATVSHSIFRYSCFHFCYFEFYSNVHEGAGGSLKYLFQHINRYLS